jgi:two-component system response regulator FixJ
MMPDMSGIALQALLRERGINLPIIFLTGSSDVPMAVDAMRNGAADFLEKPWNNGELIKRVRMAFALCENPGSRRELPDQEVARRLATLTPREREVAALMVAGMTSKVIARELGGSFRTVEIHRSRVMSKMAATHLADLVRMTFDVERSDRG